MPSVQDASQEHKHILVQEQEDASREVMTSNLPGPPSISDEMVREFLEPHFPLQAAQVVHSLDT